MGSLNKIELIGNLGKTPDVKTLENGVKVASFTLATTEPAYTTQQADTAPTTQIQPQCGQSYQQDSEIATGASYSGYVQDNDPFPF